MGSIRRTRPTKRATNGRWEARWYDDRRRQQHKTFDTKAAATKFVRQMEASRDRGAYIDHNASKTPFEEVAVDWLAGLHNIRERTEIGYRSILDRHVLPHFALTPVAKITRQDINEYVRSLEHKNLGAGTIRNIVRNVLKPILDIALEAGMIRANPCDRLRLPTSQRQEMCFLTADEVELLASAMRRPDYAVLLRFAAYTGLRAGEISALRVGRLDLTRRRVVVAESTVELPGKGLVSVAPKNGKIREVPLPEFLIDPLTAVIAERTEDAFVFLSPEGRQLRHRNFYRHHFRPAVRAVLSEKPTLRFHDLRHTCASLLIHLNENPKAIQAYLGHSSVQVTIDRYGHLMPDWQERLSDRLDKLYQSLEQPNADPGSVVGKSDTTEGSHQCPTTRTEPPTTGTSIEKTSTGTSTAHVSRPG